MILSIGDPPCEIVAGDALSPWLIPCDRASNALPYSGSLTGDTLNTHATARGLPHLLIEIRQDLVQSKSGVDEWTERLAQVLEPTMKNTQIEK